MWGPSMDADRSFYLRSKQDDFGAAAEVDRSRPVEVSYALPANDNVPARAILFERCRALLRRLIAAQGQSVR